MATALGREAAVVVVAEGEAKAVVLVGEAEVVSSRVEVMVATVTVVTITGNNRALTTIIKTLGGAKQPALEVVEVACLQAVAATTPHPSLPVTIRNR